MVLTAALADASGSPSLAFYALLALVPATAVIALAAYGDLLERSAAPDEEAPRSLQVLLWALLLVLAVAGSASRWPALHEGVPRLAATALIASVVVLCVEGCVELVAPARRFRRRKAVFY